MALYYAQLSVPTANIGGAWQVWLMYPDDIYYSGLNGTLASETAASVAAIDLLIGGSIAYSTNVSGTDTVYTVEVTNPTIVPTSISFEDVTNGELYNKGFTTIDSCTGCVSVEWAQCEDTYQIDLGLTASTTYNYILEDSHTGVQYTQNTTTTNQGVTVWDATTSPELYTVGNVFVLTATTTGGADVSFNYNGTEYSCVQITIVNQTSVYP